MNSYMLGIFTSQVFFEKINLWRHLKELRFCFASNHTALHHINNGFWLSHINISDLFEKMGRTHIMIILVM